MLLEKFAMTDLGDVSQSFGIEIERDQEAGTIEPNQGECTLSVRNRFNMSECNPEHTAGTGNKLPA